MIRRGFLTVMFLIGLIAVLTAVMGAFGGVNVAFRIGELNAQHSESSMEAEGSRIELRYFHTGTEVRVFSGGRTPSPKDWQLGFRGFGIAETTGYFGIAELAQFRYGTKRTVVMPSWLPTIAFLAPPLFVWTRRRLRRRSRLKHGLCLACGYDLRGSPPGERCPECGAERRDALGRRSASPSR